MEQVGLVEAKFGFHPIFGEEENLTVGLPDAIAFHPVPPAGIDGAGSNVQLGVEVGIFQIEQAALDKSLDRRHGKAQTGSLNHGLHAGVNQEIFKELVGFFQVQSLDSISDQDVPLLLG